MKVNITVARPDLIPEIWGVVYPMLKDAIEEDIFLSEDLLRNLLTDDKALLFLATVDGAIKGAVVIQINEAASKMAHIIALGGSDLKDWKTAMLAALDKYAFFMECKYIFSAGRRAWQRVLPEFTAGKQLFYKEVTHG